MYPHIEIRKSAIHVDVSNQVIARNKKDSLCSVQTGNCARRRLHYSRQWQCQPFSWGPWCKPANAWRNIQCLKLSFSSKVRYIGPIICFDGSYYDTNTFVLVPKFRWNTFSTWGNKAWIITKPNVKYIIWRIFYTPIFSCFLFFIMTQVSSCLLLC